MEIIFAINCSSDKDIEKINSFYKFIKTLNAHKLNLFAPVEDKLLYNALKQLPFLEIGWKPNGQQLQTLWENNYQVRQMKISRLSTMNNASMKFLNDVGFLVDSSAVPGTWSLTANAPYHPFLYDYRVTGNPCLKILEIPQITIPLYFPEDDKLVRRTIDPTISPTIFQPAFLQFSKYLTHIIINFNIENHNDFIKENIQFIINCFDKIKFTTFLDFYGQFQ